MTIALACLVAACMAANAIRLRRRLTALRRLRPSGPSGGGNRTAYTLLTAHGVTVADAVRAAAEAHAREHGLAMLDLVPSDLPVDEALDLIRHLDVRRYRQDTLGMGRGACYALLVDTEALARSGITATEDLDPDELGEATARLRLYTGTADLVVADVRSHDRTRFRRSRLRSLALVIPQTLALPQTLMAAAAGYLLMLACVALAWPYGLLVAALYCALPCVVFVGTAVIPRDLPRVTVTRLVHTPWSIWRTLRAPRTRWERRLIARREEARVWYRAQIDQGVERFAGPRRNDCPWCGSERIGRLVTVRDVLQGKPGKFHLDRCRACRHVFQNPRLTAEGLDFYYKDVYDGLGDVLAERIFSANTAWYLARVAMVRRFAEPGAWLDVGTGKAHFCRAAKTVLPGTRFDGLDMSAGVQEAVARGWVHNGYRGAFLAAAHRLNGRYDVISMHHYLEHTAEPLAELDAAVKALPSGGHLLIEMPDPESWFGRVLRGQWVPWLAPQHLNMIPLGNLRQALELRGMEVLAVERREADQGPDFVASAAAVVNRLGLDVDRPWWPRPPGRREYAGVLGTLLLAGPLMGAAIVADVATLPLRRTNSNAYRILARKQAG
ncbi:class I SAM-dependent methyltransferase [Actinomadura rayongensis]|uniref:Methyltransferase domain-containing protein n=1 Tax=Actinomadura rayongensis TaxID=1429076 RepID=A0A6I4W6G5_9ACTN|nr:class I SAM-dependent methyltransferase [Actinomadura rayongensis]MXQ65777.1 methyltransferase domain-containing protein [Actinomadura rayongensis]